MGFAIDFRIVETEGILARTVGDKEASAGEERIV
jgi:hypothetical protein